MLVPLVLGRQRQEEAREFEDSKDWLSAVQARETLSQKHKARLK